MDDLSPLEAAILKHITQNPFAGQQELADQMSIASKPSFAIASQACSTGKCK